VKEWQVMKLSDDDEGDDDVSWQPAQVVVIEGQA